MTILGQTIVAGLALAVIYVMLSTGVALVFGVLGLVNFAQGDFMTVAAYIGFTAVVSWHTGAWLSGLLMAGALAVVGVAFYYAVVVPTRRHSGEVQFIATFGVAFILQGVVQLVWGGASRSAPRNTSATQVDGITIPHQFVVDVVVAVIMLAALWAFLAATKVGRAIRATSLDPVAAELMGINTSRARLVALVVSCVLTAAGGYMILTSSVLSPTVGFAQIFSAFAIVVLAGLGSIGGAVAASVLLGIVTALTGSYISSSAVNAVPFLIILVVLVIRPTGLRGKAAA